MNKVNSVMKNHIKIKSIQYFLFKFHYRRKFIKFMKNIYNYFYIFSVK